jgi:hypothetical protein
MQRRSPQIALVFAALLVLSSAAAAQQTKCEYGRAGDGKCNAAPVYTGSTTTGKSTGGNTGATTGKSTGGTGGNTGTTTGKTYNTNNNPACNKPAGSKAKCPATGSRSKTRR